MLSEHQLKWFSRSQEISGKHLVHYRSNFFVYCKNAGIWALFPHLLFIISGTESAKFLPIFLCLYSICIKLLSIAYYFQSRINILKYVSEENKKVLQLKTEAAIDK